VRAQQRKGEDSEPSDFWYVDPDRGGIEPWQLSP
jgi:hypothetical protein